MFFKSYNRSDTKNEIRDWLLRTAADNGEELSKSRANNLADKFKKGQFDPDLARIIHYNDSTGEEATACADANESWHKLCRNCADTAPSHPDAVRRIQQKELIPA